ncbi:NAC domain-containing protein 83 [Populus alba x Populus x berolinensis]|nr:NAC domain-containing protein 83 [Populus alba x Populus x berolinensis]
MQDSNDPARRYGLVQRQMPTGCRFAPSDEVLVIHYLSKKGKNEPLPCPYAVRECDLYGREPEEIWKEFGGDRLKRKIDKDLGLFFFTRLKKKSGTHGSSRIDRSVGNNIGTWHEECALRSITCSETKKNIGSKKRFVYKSNKSHNRGRVSWHMLEISLPDNTSDHVVCQLKRIERNSIKSGRGVAGVLENGNGEGAQKRQRTVSWTNQEAGPRFFNSNKTLESNDEAKRNSSKEMLASNSTESGRGDAGVENGNDQGDKKRQRTVSWTNQEAAPSFFNSNKTPESYEAKRNSTVCGEEMGASIGGGHSFDLNIEWTNPDEDDTYTSHKERQPRFSSGKKMTEIASSSLASLVTGKGTPHVKKAKKKNTAF